jgi:hypothetical protein
MTELADIVARVQKLYALARSANEHEAANAIAAAEALIQKHRISRAELESPTDAGERACESEPLEQYSRSLAGWRKLLSAVLAHNYGCISVTDSRRRQLRIFGRPSDVMLLTLQYGRIVDQVESLTMENARGRGRSYADSYRKGIVVTIRERLREAKAQAQSTATSQAIVRLDAREAEANAALHAAANGRVRSGRKTAVRFGSEGFVDGRRDGQRVHLGDSLGPASKPLQLGSGK